MIYSFLVVGVVMIRIGVVSFKGNSKCSLIENKAEDVCILISISDRGNCLLKLVR